MDVATGLDRALRRAGIPLTSVSIGDPADRSTWTITYGDDVTPAQVAAAEAIKATYTVESDTVGADEEVAARFDENKMLKAVAIWNAQKEGVALATAKAEIIAIYKGLPG